MQSDMSTTCSYYKSDTFPNLGDIYLDNYNSKLEDYNKLVESFNNIFDDIIFFWEHTWKYN